MSFTQAGNGHPRVNVFAMGGTVAFFPETVKHVGDHRRDSLLKAGRIKQVVEIRDVRFCEAVLVIDLSNNVLSNKP